MAFVDTGSLSNADLGDLAIPSGSLDTSGIDWNVLPSFAGNTYAVPALTPASAPLGSFNDLVNGATNAITNVYGSLAKIAQAQAGVQVAKAQGQNAVQVARAGLPSVQMMALGGFALLALVIITRSPSKK